MNKDVVRLIERYGWNYRVALPNDEYKMTYAYNEDDVYMGQVRQGLMFKYMYIFVFNYRQSGVCNCCNKICHFKRETQYELPKNYW